MNSAASLISKMPCVRIVSGQISNKLGYVSCVLISLGGMGQGSESDLELLPKFLLDPGRHLWLWSVRDKKHVMFEVDELGERRQSLVDVLGELWQTPGVRDEPEFRSVEGDACLREVSAGGVEPPSMKANCGPVKIYLNLKVHIVPLADF